MNPYFLIASLLCFLLGIIHSFLGERLIFRYKRAPGKLVPSLADRGFKEAHLRIIWATWHLASVFGWCLGAILLKFAIESPEGSQSFVEFILATIAGAMLAGAALVLIGTKGRHPGWVMLLVIGVLLFFS